MTHLLHSSMRMQNVKIFMPVRHFKHIPPQPITLVEHSSDGCEVVLDEDIMLLERLSLVDFGNRQGVERLTEAIKFASTIKDVNTDNVEPLCTVEEDRLVYEFCCLNSMNDNIRFFMSGPYGEGTYCIKLPLP